MSESVSPDLVQLQSRIDAAARDLPPAEKALLRRMVIAAADKVIDGFRAYSTEFGEAFRAGQARMTISYDDDTRNAAAAGGVTGKYHSDYIKP